MELSVYSTVVTTVLDQTTSVIRTPEHVMKGVIQVTQESSVTNVSAWPDLVWVMAVVASRARRFFLSVYCLLNLYGRKFSASLFFADIYMREKKNLC